MNEQHYEGEEGEQKFDHQEDSIAKPVETEHNNLGTHKCDDCAKSFRNNRNLCDNCGKAIGDSLVYKTLFECKQCGRQYTRKCSLMRHVNYVHNNLPPYKCDVCGKTYCQNKDLHRHHQTNDQSGNVKHDVGPFECELCDLPYHFTKLKYLQLHVLRYHNQEPSRNYECDVCLGRFVTNDQLVKHKLMHSKSSLSDYLNMNMKKSYRTNHCSETNVRTSEQLLFKEEQEPQEDTNPVDGDVKTVIVKEDYVEDMNNGTDEQAMDLVDVKLELNDE